MKQGLWVALIGASLLIAGCGYGRVTQGPNRALFGEDLKANQAECWWIGFGPTCPEVER